MNEIAEKSANTVIEAYGVYGVFILAALGIIGGLFWFLHRAMKMSETQAGQRFDDSRIVEVLSDLRDEMKQSNHELRTEMSVGFKGLEKTLETYIRMRP